MKNITVVVMTYNHKDYIKEALDSILSQQTSFDFDVLIHDDCSDDGTEKIVSEYENNYPNVIRVVRQKNRRFPIDGFNMMIYKYVVPYIDSKYVAYCDGDDYWCDQLKLQKQFDFMESHPDYSMCYHCAFQLRQNNDMSSRWFIKDEGDIELKDLINEKPGVPVATSSLFVKSSVFVNFSEWRKAYTVEDLPLYMTAAISGKIHRLKDIMCVYRQFSNGSWSSQNKNNVDRLIIHQNKLINNVQYFDKETKFLYHDLVSAHIKGCEFRIALLKRDFKKIFSTDNKALLKQLPIKEIISLKLQYRLPGLYNLLHKQKKD